MVEAPVVLGGCGIAEPRLEQAHDVGVGVGPVALLLLRRDRIEVVGEGVVSPDRRHRQVARQQIEQRRDVRRPLDARVPAQRHDAAAGAPDVAQQQLQDRGGTDELGAQGVLRPSRRVPEAGRPFASRVVDDRPREIVEFVDGDAAHVADHLGRVPREMPFEDLEHGPRMLQGIVAPDPCVAQRRSARTVFVAGSTVRCARPVLAALLTVRVVRWVVVRPRRRIVLPGFRVEAGEQSAQVLGVAVILTDQRRRVGIGHHVVMEVALVGDRIVDQSAEQNHVRTGADRDVFVGDRRGPGEPRIDMDHPCAARLGLGHPLETHRVCFGHVAADEHDAIGVGHVL